MFVSALCHMSYFLKCEPARGRCTLSFSPVLLVPKIMSDPYYAFNRCYTKKQSHLILVQNRPLLQWIPCGSGMIRNLTRMPQLVRGRARTHTSRLSHPVPTQALPPPLASSWRPTQGIRSKEADLACVRAGAACVTQGAFILRGRKFLLISGWPW